MPSRGLSWRALRRAAEENLAAGICEQVTLINAAAPITAKLRANHLDRCLQIVP